MSGAIGKINAPECDRSNAPGSRGSRSPLGSLRAAERAAISTRRRTDHARKPLPKVGRIFEADFCGDLLDRKVARLEQLLRAPYPFRQQPLQRRGAGLIAKTPAERARAHRRAARHFLEAEIRIQMRHHPLQQRREAARRAGSCR